MRNRLISAALCLIFAQALSFAAEHARLNVSLDPSITTVLPAGNWQSAAGYGTCRVIVQSVGWDNVRSLVFAQWLKVDETQRTIQEVATTSIAELNDRDWCVVRNVRFENGTCRITYSTRGAEDAEKIVEVRLENIGRYKLLSPQRHP